MSSNVDVLPEKKTSRKRKSTVSVTGSNESVSTGTNEKRTHGKSCLVCRKRKIKCDLTKPVCLACVKHGSSMDCEYPAMKSSSANGSSINPLVATALISIKTGKSNTAASANTIDSISPEKGVVDLSNALHATPLSTDQNNTTTTATNNNNNNNNNNNDDGLLNNLLDEQSGNSVTPDRSTYSINNSLPISLLRKVKTSINNKKNNAISLKIKKNIRKQQMIKEFSELKKKLESLETLLEGSIKEEEFEMKSSNTLGDSPINSHSRTSDEFYGNEDGEDGADGEDEYEDQDENHIGDAYGKFMFVPKMSFYDGFEQVNVLSARLLFLGPLSSSTILKKDQFCVVLNAMINKTRDDIAKALEVQTDEKYKGLRVTAKHMTEQVNIHIKPHRKTMFNETSPSSLLQQKTMAKIKNCADRKRKSSNLAGTNAEKVTTATNKDSASINKRLDGKSEKDEEKMTRTKDVALNKSSSNSTKRPYGSIKNTGAGKKLSNKMIKTKSNGSSTKTLNKRKQDGEDVEKELSVGITSLEEDNIEEEEEEEGEEQEQEEEEEVEEVFEQKLLENEGLDEMDTIVQEGKIANNPLSVENLLNSKMPNNQNSRSNSTIVSSKISDVRSDPPAQIPQADAASIRKSLDGQFEDEGTLPTNSSTKGASSTTIFEPSELPLSFVTHVNQPNSAQVASTTNETTDQKLLDLDLKENPDTKSMPSTDLKPEDDINLWRTLDTVLTNIKQQNHVPEERIPEKLFGQSNETKGKQELEVLMRIRTIMPSTKIIRMHIDNFFQSPMYGLFPILNEDWFRDTLQTIIGGLDSNFDQQPKINATRRFDLSKLGSLLVVLRLSFLQYPESLGQCQTEEERFVLSHPIGKEFIDTAQMCLNLFKMLRKGILPVLHCALLLRVYRKFAPEDGDIVDGADSETFTGLLVKISTSIGLNTDVGRSQWAQQEPMYIDQWRKCWYVVYHFDFMEAVNMGNTLSIDVDTFDTKLPEFKLNPNTGIYPPYVMNPQLEDIMVSNTQKNFQMSLICRELLSAITNKRRKFSVLELQVSIDKLDQFIRTEYGPDLNSIINMPATSFPEVVEKLNSFKNFVDINSLIFMVYLHIFIHIDKNIISNLKNIQDEKLLSENIELFHYYFKKVISLYVEMEPTLILCYESRNKNSLKVEEIFGRGTRLLVIQSCEYVLTRFTLGMYMVICRVLHFHYECLKKSGDDTPIGEQADRAEIFSMVKKILACSMDKLAYSNSVCRLLSQKYFQIWRISKSSQFLFQLLNNSENNLFDKTSKINQSHRKEYNMNIGKFPFTYIPHFNILRHYTLAHFQEIYSTLCSVKWKVFQNHLTNEELIVAKNFRHSSTGEKSIKISLKKSKKSHGVAKNSKSNAKNDSTAKNSLSVEKPKNDSTENVLDDVAPSLNKNSSNSSITPHTAEVDIPIDEIDQFWYNTIFAQPGNAVPLQGPFEIGNEGRTLANTVTEKLSDPFQHFTREQSVPISDVHAFGTPTAKPQNASESIAPISDEALNSLFTDKDTLKAQVFQKLQELKNFNMQNDASNMEQSLYQGSNDPFAHVLTAYDDQVNGASINRDTLGINLVEGTSAPREEEEQQQQQQQNMPSSNGKFYDGSGIDDGFVDQRIKSNHTGDLNIPNSNLKNEFTHAPPSNDLNSGNPAIDIMRLQEMFNNDFLMPGSNFFYGDDNNF